MASRSVIMKDWPISVIHNPIDTDFWAPISKRFAREVLGIKQDRKIVLFGSADGTRNKNKGFSLLKEAINHIDSRLDICLIILGEAQNQDLQGLNCEVFPIGKMHDEISLKILYNAADVVAVPSRIENLPNTAVEAHACGVPVVAFNVGGLSDIVDHKLTGYLSEPYNTRDFAIGLNWVFQQLAKVDSYKSITHETRDRIMKKFSYKVIGEAYESLYRQVSLKSETTSE